MSSSSAPSRRPLRRLAAAAGALLMPATFVSLIFDLLDAVVELGRERGGVRKRVAWRDD